MCYLILRSRFALPKISCTDDGSHSEGSCTRVVELSSLYPVPSFANSTLSIPPSSTRSPFLAIHIPAPCLFSDEYDVLSTAAVYPVGTQQQPNPGFTALPLVPLHRAQVFTQEYSLFAPTWSRVPTFFQHRMTVELRYLDEPEPWFMNASAPNRTITEHSMAHSTIDMPPCGARSSFVEALQAACPAPGPCSPITLTWNETEIQGGGCGLAEQALHAYISSVSLTVNASRATVPMTQSDFIDGHVMLSSLPIPRSLPSPLPLVEKNPADAWDDSFIRFPGNDTLGPRQIQCQECPSRMATTLMCLCSMERCCCRMSSVFFPSPTPPPLSWT